MTVLKLFLCATTLKVGATCLWPNVDGWSESGINAIILKIGDGYVWFSFRSTVARLFRTAVADFSAVCGCIAICIRQACLQVEQPRCRWRETQNAVGTRQSGTGKHSVSASSFCCHTAPCYFVSPPGWVRSIAVSMSVCFYVCLRPRISQKSQPNLVKFSVHLNYVRGLGLLMTVHFVISLWFHGWRHVFHSECAQMTQIG